ncbi:MAG TPA: hypothetical protein VM240_12430 [Verrucomicrobiae bacterium]|nr:hypothetical protein [Verrucomicrobiae bacterium]
MKVAFALLSSGFVASCAAALESPQMQCSPTSLQSNDVLTVQLTVPHGRQFGVWTPDNEFLFLSYNKATPEEPTSPFDPTIFRTLAAVQLNVASARGVPVRDGFDPPEAIFSKAGSYQFLVAENLETDNAPGAVAECIVTYARR